MNKMSLQSDLDKTIDENITITKENLRKQQFKAKNVPTIETRKNIAAKKRHSKKKATLERKRGFISDDIDVTTQEFSRTIKKYITYCNTSIFRNIRSIYDNMLNLNIKRKLNISTNNNCKFSYEQWKKNILSCEKIFKEYNYEYIEDKKEELLKKVFAETNTNQLAIINSIIDIYGNTVESKYIIENYIENLIKNNKWIKNESFKILKCYSFSNISLIKQLIIKGICSCPNEPIIILESLLFKKNYDNILQKYFDKLNMKDKDYVITDVIIKFVEYIKNNKDVHFMHNKLNSILENVFKVNKLLKELIFDKLDDIVDFLSNIDTNILSEIIKQMIVHKNNSTQMITGIIESLGIVGIKIAQFFAENNNIPKEWKHVISQSRENNKPSSLLEFSKNFSIYSPFYEIGRCLGVGSVKQVHLIRDVSGKIYVFSQLKKNCEKKAKNIIQSLKKIRSYSKFACDMEKIIESEINFNNEKKSFDLIKTPIFKKSNILIFPEIIYSSSNSIIRSYTEGQTILSLVHENKINDQIKSLISQLHILLVKTLLEDKIVFSDIHLGNVVYHEHIHKLSIIDVGQYLRLNDIDIKTALLMIADISKKKEYIHTLNINHLGNILQIKKDDLEKINKVFKDSYKMKQSDAINNITRYIHDIGYQLSDSLMRIFKMINLIIQQKETFNLDNDISDLIVSYFKKQSTYFDYGKLLYNYVIKLGN